MRRVLVLVLLVALGLGAELWVNAIRDPSAELGQGDWETDFYEWPEGAADNARVSAHDTTRVYEGEYSFLTDTEKDPGLENENCDVWCFQDLRFPKAVQDIDSCFWNVYVDEGLADYIGLFHIIFRSDKKQVIWVFGAQGGINDTVYAEELPLPDSGEWSDYSYDLYSTWVNAAGWSASDTIKTVRIESRGWSTLYWMGQEVSWDNIVLQSIAYYDYASKSIDSDGSADQHYTPVATFVNEGILDDKDGVVYAEILDGETRVYIDSQSVSIPTESSEQITFSEWTVPHDGSYTLRVYPILELDEFSGDDTLVMILTGEGIEENPLQKELVRTSYNSTGVLFSFPSGTSGQLTVYDASGREVYAVSIAPGTPELRWFTREVPSGLYFYNLKSSERVSTGKLIIIH